MTLQAEVLASGAGWLVRDMHCTAGPRDRRFEERLVLVVGSEGRGLTPAVQQAVQHWLRIPTDPRVDSLNAAAAAAVVLYEIARSGAASP